VIRTLLLSLVACGSDKADPPKPEPPTPEALKPEAPKPKPEAPKPAAQPALTITLDGKPIAIQSVVAVDDGDGRVEILLKNYAYTCKELTEGFTARSSEPTDVDLKLRAGKFLHPDGKLGWAIRGTYLVGRTATGTTTSQSEKEHGGDPLPLAIVLDVTAGKTTDVPLELTMKTIGNEASPAQTLMVKGTAKVSGCGDSKFKKTEVLVPQPGAVIEIAGQALPIVGAGYIEKKDGTRALQLATHPVKCVDGSNYTSTRADVALELAFDKAGKLYAVEREGAWVDWAINQNAPALTATPSRPPRGAKELVTTLGGSTTIGGYPITLRGKVRATVCATPSK
jgi:hypothetical protein